MGPTVSCVMSSMLWDRELLRSAEDPPSVPRAGLPPLGPGVPLVRIMDTTPESETTTEHTGTKLYCPVGFKIIVFK